MNLKIICYLLLLLEISVCSGYRILALFTFHGRSHFRVLQPMAKALAARGHQVDVISHFPLQKPMTNYSDIVQLTSVNKYASIDYKTIISADKLIDWIFKKINDTCDYLGHPKIAKLIQENRRNLKYDLLLVHDLTGIQCMNAIGYVWNVPVISVVTTSLYPWMHHFTNNPLNMAISPAYLINSQSDVMTFSERFRNLYKTFEVIHQYYGNAQSQQYFINKYFGYKMPNYREIEQSVALTFTNTHYSITEVKPKTPALIEVAGIHIQEDSTPMDKNLKRFLDDSKNGFVYFSFGSMFILESFPHSILEKFYSAIRKIAPMPVITRVENSSLLSRNLPSNLFTHPWLPQQKILKHPNIKAFISHGGSLGTQEALHFGVPMICIPIFAEQNGNCNSLKQKNVALKLNYDSSTQEEFDEAFRAIISNSTYKESVKKLSKLFNDRPKSPVDEVVYWTEYIIRHGASALRSPADKLHWWQIEMLDVYAFVLVCLTLATFFTSLIVCLILKWTYDLIFAWKILYRKKID